MNRIVVEIEKIIAGGDGLAFHNGKAHFVPGVLPGEIVEVKVIEEKKGFNRCVVTDIKSPSSNRLEPFCKYFGECGGCSLQFTNYDNQLKLKEAIVKDIFLRIGKIDLKEINTIRSKDKEYRNRIQLHYDGKNLGFKKIKSNDIVNIDNCPLLVKGLNNFLKDHKGIEVGRNLLFSNGENCKIGGVDNETSVNILEHEIWFDPGSFFQSNLSILPDLIPLVNNSIVGESVMDLYCGVGFFSSFLDVNIKRIVAVEMDSRVKPFIEKNVKRNIEFHNSTLENYVKKNKNNKDIDTIIIDPPRKGLADNVKKFIKDSGAKRVIYISCDPVTMARDIGEMIKYSYKLKSYTMLDFFPYTPHIESLAVLDLV